MANIASQIKRNRQTVTRQARNQAIRSELKTRTKAVATASRTGDAEAVDTAFRLAQKRIDSAVSKGVMHKRTAARHKSRLARKVQQPPA